MWKNTALININEANVSGANGRTGANCACAMPKAMTIAFVT